MSKINDTNSVQARIYRFLFELRHTLSTLKSVTQLFFEQHPTPTQDMAKWLEQLDLIVNRVREKMLFLKENLNPIPSLDLDLDSYLSEIHQIFEDFQVLQQECQPDLCSELPKENFA